MSSEGCIPFLSCIHTRGVSEEGDTPMTPAKKVKMKVAELIGWGALPILMHTQH